MLRITLLSNGFHTDDDARKPGGCQKRGRAASGARSSIEAG